MKVYLDENNMCHLEAKEGYVEAEHTFFDTVPPLAIEYYKFIPEHNFIQCTNSQAVDLITKQYNASEEKYNQVLYDIAVDIGAIVFNQQQQQEQANEGENE